MLLTAAACSSGGQQIGQGSTNSGKSITVDMFYPSPPKAVLAQFTKQTGIKVQLGRDRLGRPADQDRRGRVVQHLLRRRHRRGLVRVGEYAKTGWFQPMNKWFNPASLKSDVPQLARSRCNGKLIGMPIDASFMVTTVNTKDFKAAGVAAVPTTAHGLTAALKKLQAHGMATRWTSTSPPPRACPPTGTR